MTCSILIEIGLCLFQSNHFHNKLNEILDMVDDPPPVSSNPDTDKENSVNSSVPVFEMQFPDLFVY